MTEAERRLVEALSDVWNQFVALPEQHPMDRQEFCSGVHRLQEKVAARPALRELNKGSAK
jgi:hypothetical protein